MQDKSELTLSGVNGKSALDQLFEDSKTCCVIAGQSTEITKEHKLQQYGYIKEELQELHDAIEAGDLVEQLDATVDILVTVFGFMQKLEKQGADLEKAMLKTAKNNLSKFPTDRDVVQDTIKFYKEKGKDCTSSYSVVYNRWVIRDEQGKYKKCKGFVENDLSDCFWTARRYE